jgi:hypothetical protein
MISVFFFFFFLFGGEIWQLGKKLKINKRTPKKNLGDF